MTAEQALARLMAECSRGEICTSAAREKLAHWLESKAESPAEIIEKIIDRLVKEKFIDDERFAGAFTRDRYNFYGWGPRKVEFKLKELKISRQVIERVLEQEQPLADKTLKRILAGKEKALERQREKKIAQLKQAVRQGKTPASKESMETYKIMQQHRAKLLSFATSRGFDYSKTMALIQSLE